MSIFVLSIDVVLRVPCLLVYNVHNTYRYIDSLSNIFFFRFASSLKRFLSKVFNKNILNSKRLNGLPKRFFTIFWRQKNQFLKSNFSNWICKNVYYYLLCYSNISIKCAIRENTTHYRVSSDQPSRC